MDCHLLKKLKLLVDPSCKLKVMAANRVQLATQGICHSVSWKAQGHQFSIDFMVLLIKGCDVVLGIQWLLTLGSIFWNFASLTMQFEYVGKVCTLQDLLPGGLHMVTEAERPKCFSILGQGPRLVLLSTSEHITLNLPTQILHADIERLLVEFGDTFQLPNGLPPVRL